MVPDGADGVAGEGEGDDGGAGRDGDVVGFGVDVFVVVLPGEGLAIFAHEGVVLEDEDERALVA